MEWKEVANLFCVSFNPTKKNRNKRETEKKGNKKKEERHDKAVQIRSPSKFSSIHFHMILYQINEREK